MTSHGLGIIADLERLDRPAVARLGDALAGARKATRATTIDWLLAARSHAAFANQGGRYDDVKEYLSRREIRRALTL